MADDSKDKSPTPEQVAWEIARIAVSVGLIPVWIRVFRTYRTHPDASEILDGVVLTVIIATILGGGIYFGFRRLRRRRR